MRFGFKAAEKTGEDVLATAQVCLGVGPKELQVRILDGECVLEITHPEFAAGQKVKVAIAWGATWGKCANHVRLLGLGIASVNRFQAKKT